jgi:hypothetical protein
MTDNIRYEYKGLRLCLAACLGLAVTGCTVPVSELDLSKETIEHLPRDVALSFLMSQKTDESSLDECVFQPEGVVAVHNGVQHGGVVPYSDLTLRAGPFGNGFLELKGRILCFFGGPVTAKHQGMSNRAFLRKTVTALLALGVRPAE